MSLLKCDDFLADVERQFEWYVLNAGWEIADRYLAAVEATCHLLAQHPLLGPRGRFTHPGFGTGGSSWCFVPSTNTFFSTK